MPEETGLSADERKTQSPTQAEIDEAKRHFASGDMRAAENAARTLTQRFPGHAFGWKVLAAAAKSAGRAQDALEPLLRARQLEPEDPVGHYNLGVVLAETARLAEAERSFRESIRLRPDFAEAHFHLGSVLASLRRWREAEICYGETVGLAPTNADAHSNRGYSLFNLGRLDDAVRSYREAIRCNPDAAEAHYNLAIALKTLGSTVEAEQSFREALRCRPDFAEAFYNLGHLLHNQGRATEAEKCYREAIRCNPGDAEAHFGLGVALEASGRPDAAEASLRAALRANPAHAEAHFCLGNVLAALQRSGEAEISYRQAIRLRPDHAQAYCHLAIALAELGRLPEAEKSYRDALRIEPSFAAAHTNLGVALAKLGRLNAAVESYRAAIAFNPDYVEAHSGLGVVLADLCRLDEAVGSFREALRRDPGYSDARSNLLFCLNYMESRASAATLAEAQLCGAAISARAEPKCLQRDKRAASQKLRVGFVSGDLRNHPVGFFSEGLFKHLDRQRFELFAFPTAPRADDLTARIKPGFNGWVPIFGKSDRDAATRIQAQEIDVLVDLSGHSADNRLPVFAYRPASVQVSWLGYFATTGLPEMDYFLGDPHMAPAGEERHFSEKLWRLPETWLCFTPPTHAIDVAPPPAARNGHVTFGCFSNLSKVGDAVVDLWAEILHAVPSAKIMLKAGQLADAALAAQTLARFASRGVAEDRIILEGPSQRAAYLDAYTRIDIVLDTFPYPGGTTSLEALWMGVPVLTCKGNRFLSRLGESIATNAGQHDWIAADHDDYAKKAVAFADDWTLLAKTRATLRERLLQTPLIDAQRFARHFGDALLGMYREKTGP